MPLDINSEVQESYRVGNEIEFMHEMHDAIETIPERVQNQRPSTNQADEPQGVSSPPKNLFCPGLGSYYDQLCSPSVKNDVIMDDVQSVVKEKTEPIASMLAQSNAILDKLAGDDGRIQVGLQGQEQGVEDELICLHPKAESGMENTCAEYIQHVDRNDSLGKLSFFFYLTMLFFTWNYCLNLWSGIINSFSHGLTGSICITYTCLV